MNKAQLRSRAEQELLLAKQAIDENLRRTHYLRAGILLNLSSGGDRSAKGRAGYTY